MLQSPFYNSSEQLQSELENGSVTAELLVKEHFARIASHNSSLQALVITDESNAINFAKTLDAERKDGKIRSKLHGIPVTVKESFNMKSQKTTVNFSLIKNNVATSDAVIVQRLRDRGAVILGKTNVPTLLADNQVYGPIYPTANNPFDLSRTPGGSTGGGAAAVAAGLTTFEIGTDIGGSIRNPANFCGLFGMKPTENQYIQSGHVPPLPNSDGGFIAMASVGPLARTMTDLKMAWEVIKEPDWKYLNSLPVKSDRPITSDLSSLKIGWFDEVGDANCSDTTKSLLKRLLDSLEKSGATVDKLPLDYQWMLECYKTWATMFGFVTGQNAPWIFRQLMKHKFRRQTKGSSFNVSSSLGKGLSMDFKQFSRALRNKQELIAQLMEWFDQFDFIISPTSYGPAFTHNHRHRPISYEGLKIPYSEYNFAYTLPYNICGNPVLVVPAGQDSSGLPIGLQIAAPHHAEDSLISFGKLIEGLGYKFEPPPAFTL